MKLGDALPDQDQNFDGIRWKLACSLWWLHILYLVIGYSQVVIIMF